MTEQQASFRELLGTVGAWFDQAARHTDQALAQQQQEARRLGEQVRELRAQVVRLEERFTQILATEHERRRPGASRSEDLDYYEVADDWREFYRFLHEKARDALGAPAQAEERAVLVSILMRALVRGEDGQRAVQEALAEQVQPPRGLAKEIHQAFAKIMERADGLGRECRWLFPDPAQGGISPAWHEAWSGCSPDDPVRFLVTPAFVVDGKPRVKALVYTAPDAAE